MTRRNSMAPLLRKATLSRLHRLSACPDSRLHRLSAVHTKTCYVWYTRAQRSVPREQTRGQIRVW